MIEYSVKGFDETWPRIKDLVVVQWNEVDERRKTSDISVVEEFYSNLQESGSHYIVVAEEERTVIGYSSIFLTPSPHTGTLHAMTDVMYVVPEQRGNSIGLGLIHKAEEEAVTRGAHHFFVTFKNNVSHENIVEKLGFFNYETTYSKPLKDLK